MVHFWHALTVMVKKNISGKFIHILKVSSCIVVELKHMLPFHLTLRNIKISSSFRPYT